MQSMAPDLQMSWSKFVKMTTFVFNHINLKLSCAKYRFRISLKAPVQARLGSSDVPFEKSPHKFLYSMQV